MDIVKISLKPGLYTVRFDGKEKNEYSQFLNSVTDLDYVIDYLTNYATMLDHPFWRRHGFSSSEDSIFACAHRIVDEAFEMVGMINDIISGKRTEYPFSFTELFQPLDGPYKNVWELVPSKAYGPCYPSFLRLYAIALKDGGYVIVDGGIKLADSIQNDPDLSTHVFKKIDSTKRFLIDNDIYLQDDI